MQNLRTSIPNGKETENSILLLDDLLNPKADLYLNIKRTQDPRREKQGWIF